MKTGVTFFLILMILSSPSVGQTGTEEVQVRNALSHFIRAFDDLDWDAFRFSFADDATVFYPRGVPERASGRAEFEKTFKVVFEQIRNGKSAGPYMDIQPRGLKIQLFGGVAIATFHLDDRVVFIYRRTIVLSRSKAGWRIVHLHASDVPRQ
jgi:ketosteroid isomerase-like protein